MIVPRRWLRATLVVAVLALSGCTETPAQGFEAFFSALADQSPEAFARLSTRAQADVSTAARNKGLEPTRFLTSAVPRSTVRSVTVVEDHGDSAVVEVKDALGNTQRVPMVKEEGRWRVDLSL